MKKSTHSKEYEAVLNKLVEMRRETELTQRQLAEKLDREHSFVWRIEKGERRLDVVEFFWVCNALGYNAAEVYSELCTAFTNVK